MLLTKIVINQIIGKSQHSKVVLVKDREDHKTSSTWSAEAYVGNKNEVGTEVSYLLNLAGL
jgi:hypothetical protein